MLFALPVSIPWSAPERKGYLRVGPRWGRASREPRVHFSPLLAWFRFSECNRSRLHSSQKQPAPHLVGPLAITAISRYKHRTVPTEFALTTPDRQPPAFSAASRPCHPCREWRAGPSAPWQ